ncbi:MAG TPA: hypothetical protein GXZ47_04815 [Treponema sp.]|nr:hypothetical protein [Treponema sp.]
MKSRITVLAAVICLTSFLYAQEVSLPDTYRAISLGMDLETVQEQLKKDGIFGYRGERDVSLLHSANRSLIETMGPSFISRSWFQFHQENLYVMIFKLDTTRIDYYSMYTALVKKYGEPSILDPRKALWTDERITLTLERPLTVKYVDMTVFSELTEADTSERAVSDILREEFIRGF